MNNDPTLAYGDVDGVRLGWIENARRYVESLPAPLTDEARTVVDDIAATCSHFIFWTHPEGGPVADAASQLAAICAAKKAANEARHYNIDSTHVEKEEN